MEGSVRTATTSQPGSAAGQPGPGGAQPGSAAGQPDSAAAGMRRVLRNAGALLVAYALPRAATFAGVVVAARYLGAAEFGAYGTAAGLAVILSIIATLGMMPLLIRELVREPGRAPALLGAAHLAKSGANLLMLAAVYLLAGPVLDFPGPVPAAALVLGLGYAVGAYAENLGAWFHARERMDVWMRAQAAFGLATGAVGIAAVVATGSVVWFCGAFVAGQAAALGWLLAAMPAPLRRAARPAATDLARLLRALAPFAVGFVLLTLYSKVDILLLARLRAAAEVGVYAAAYKLVDAAQALAVVGAAAVYPRLARRAPAGTHAGAGPNGGWTGRRVVELALMAAVPAAGALWLLRGPVIQLLYGPAYAGATLPLALLAPALPALAANIVAGYVLAAAGRMGSVALLYAGGVALNVGLNLVLIPGHGAAGAGAAMLVSEWALAGGFLLVLAGTGAAPRLRALALAAAGIGLAGAMGLAAAASPALAGVPAALAFGIMVAVVYARAGALAEPERALLRELARR